jgi:hypothetical protein
VQTFALPILRGDRGGVAGALLAAFVATGLHQFHFHPLFAAPFLVWLAVRRQWGRAAVYGLGYLAIILFWLKIYPLWLIDFAGPDANVARIPTLSAHAASKAGRLLDVHADLWAVNFVRFAAWQNVVLLPLIAAAWPVLRSKRARLHGPFLPLVAACAIGLLLLVNQGHGWGYRYLSGLIGCFCLLAGYGWTSLVPEAGSARAWAAVKCGAILTLAVILPLQLALARAFVAPYAELRREIGNAPVDVVLVDPEGGFYADDIVQNGPGFDQRPLVMHLAFVAPEDLASLCSARTIMRVDRRHFRAAGMASSLPAPGVRRALKLRRDILDRLGCAPPLPIPST